MQPNTLFHCQTTNTNKNMKLHLHLSVYFLSALFFFSCTKSTDLSKAGSGEALSDSYSGLRSGPGGGSSGNGGGTAGVITAGEWNDLDNWNFWKTLLTRDTIKDIPATWGLFTNNKVSIVLKDANNRLLHDATITMLHNGEKVVAKTDNQGKAVLFAGLTKAGTSLTKFTLKAGYNGANFDLGTFNHDGNIIYKTIPVTKAVTKKLDILFVVDATGSMGDEITYLKTELQDVINRSGTQLPGMQINMGSVFYRDNGDDYVTRPFDFTTSSSRLISFIKEQQAGGGGDFPEAVDEALKVGTQNMQWSTKAVNRLLFLVLDAPPHKLPAQVTRLKDAIKTAQEKGIRIIPISASGIDLETEFLLRFLSISTNSTYIFITNDSGIGNPHHVPTVGTYTVEFLNNLMVRLITKYGKNMD